MTAPQSAPREAGMVSVTEKGFYATVGQLDVTPNPTGRWSDEIGYRTEWKTRSGRLVGVSFGNPQEQYAVTPEFFAEHRAAPHPTPEDSQ